MFSKFCRKASIILMWLSWTSEQNTSKVLSKAVHLATAASQRENLFSLLTNFPRGHPKTMLIQFWLLLSTYRPLMLIFPPLPTYTPHLADVVFEWPQRHALTWDNFMARPSENCTEMRNVFNVFKFYTLTQNYCLTGLWGKFNIFEDRMVQY